MASDPTRSSFPVLDERTPENSCFHWETSPPYSVPRRSPRTANYRDLSMSYEGLEEELPVRAPDLSATGLFINTPRYFAEGSVLNLSFRLARSGREVKARAEVRYCLAGVGIGVEFVEISAEDQDAIEFEGQ
jgi:hypothetical protein